MNSNLTPWARRSGWLLLLLVLAAGAWMVWWHVGQRLVKEDQRSLPATNAITRPASLAVKPEVDSTNIFSDVLHRLPNGKSPDAARALCEKLRSDLNSLPRPEAARRIREFLDSGEDASTRLPFTLEADGTLKTAPSLRVFLLDLLGQLDPQSAAMVAEELLKNPTSPDEWAVCLRNYALGSLNPAAADFLQEKLRAMWANEAWRNDPSTGYLEAFDVVVFVGGTNLFPALASLVSDRGSPALAHAAFMALDRIAINDTTATLSMLQSHPEFLAGHEATRASFFARADVRDLQQREVLEKYLLNPVLGPAELENFSGLFPNANFMVSFNLLSQTQTPSSDTLARRDRAALQTVESWLADSRFQRLQPQLQKIRTRLATFLNSPPVSR